MNLGWLDHVSKVIEAGIIMSQHLAQGRPAVVHCRFRKEERRKNERNLLKKLISFFFLSKSDGWDRTAQVASIAALLCDERCRSFAGFCRVVAREWVFLGHKFGTRLGAGLHRNKGLVFSPVLFF